MKRFIIILTFGATLFSAYAEKQNTFGLLSEKIQSNVAIVSKNKEGVYSFSHNLNMTDEKKAVWTKRIMNDRKVIKIIEILDNKVFITFNEDIGEKEIEEAITYCVSKFGYQSIKLN
ncbi:MAG: hypothetical protein ACK4K0_05895 [Flavobacteriales bacterium]